MEILVNTLPKVKKFNEVVSKYTFPIEVKKGEYLVDAKSIIGLLSMNLIEPIELVVNDDYTTDFMEEIQQFLVI